MTIRNLLLAFLPLFCAGTSHAQDTTTHWSLQDCLVYAKAHNIALQQAAVDVTEARYNQQSAKGQLLPSIGGSASQSYNIGLGIDPVTNQKKNQTTRANNFGLSGSWTLFNGFAVLNGIKKATQDLQATRFQRKQQEYALTLQIINDYLQILLNAEMLQAAKRQEALSQTFYDNMEVLLQSGEKSKSDVADAAAQLAEDQQQLIMAANNLKIARRDLAQQLQLRDLEHFRIVYAIPVVTDTTLIQQPLKQIYAHALENYPAIQQRAAEVRSATLNWRMNKSSLWPSLSFSSGVNTLYSDQYLDANDHKIPFNRQWKDNLGHFFNFNLDIPLFNKYYTRSAIHMAKKEIDKARLQQEQSRSDLWQALQSVYDNVHLYKRAYTSATKAQQALEKALHYAQIRYQTGETAYYDYLQARNRYTQAESNAIQNKYSYLYNALLLQYYFNASL